MKRIMKYAFLAIGLTIFTTTVKAQDEVETTIAADVVNQYIWRGQELGSSSLQPTLGLAYKGFSLTAWGSVGLSEPADTKEFDLTAAYTAYGFNIGITDYWFNSPFDRYFYYNTHGTSHVFEANIGYDFGLLSLQWFTNFAGNDAMIDGNGNYGTNGKRRYSSYVEIAAPFKLGGCDWSAAVGAVPFRTCFYSKANGFAVTNISLKATKELRITDSFAVPVFAGITCNPSTQKSFFVFGLTLKP